MSFTKAIINLDMEELDVITAYLWVSLGSEICESPPKDI
jgi:hypothetical protein